MKKYNAVVIGAGSIGALKDDKFDSPKTKNILTIAHAFYNNDQINLIGIVDIDIKKAEKAAKKWSTEAYENVFAIEQPIDIIAVCVPTEFHAMVLLNLLKLSPKPKLIIAEKPFCSTKEQAKIIIDAYKEADIPIAMDFIRRFDIVTHGVYSTLRSGTLGKILSCRLIYTRGLKHEACHALDLMRHFFGEFKEGKILSYDKVYDDYSKDDLTYPVYMSFENCDHVFFTPSDGRMFSVFEIDIITEKSRLVFTEHGLYIDSYPVEPEKTYGNYNTLSSNPKRFKTNLEIALSNLVKNCINHIDENSKIAVELLCTADDALKIHEIYEILLGDKR